MAIGAEADPVRRKLHLEIVLELVAALHASLEGPTSVAIHDLLVIVA